MFLGISSQEMLFLVTSIFRKPDPGQSFPWQALGFEVKTSRKVENEEYKAIDEDKKRKLRFKEITDNQKIVVEEFVSSRDFLMVAPTASGKSLIFHIVPFKNISLHK